MVPQSKPSKKFKAKVIAVEDNRTILETYFRDSWTIVVARVSTFGAFVTGVIGALDWSPLLGLSSFDRKQMLITAGIVLAIGVSTEVARRRTQ